MFHNMFSGGRTMRHSHPARKVRAYRLRLEVLEDRTLLSTYLVDHLADDTVGTGLNGSLRYAITHAADGDAISFGVTGSINLTGALPDLTHSININGPGANLLTVRRDTGGNYGIFRVSATVALSGLTIANGYFYPGSGIYNQGSLTLSNCTVSGNTFGGIYNQGSLTLSNCTVSGNIGGGIYNSGPGSLTLSNCVVTENENVTSLQDAGGITNRGSLTVNNCIVSNNYGVKGGGIGNYAGAATVNNSTIANNRSQSYSEEPDGNGGGVANYATMTIANSTISGNTAWGNVLAYGGGIYKPYNLGAVFQVFSTEPLFRILQLAARSPETTPGQITGRFLTVAPPMP
jgi:parallel beta-helix repeat protein